MKSLLRDEQARPMRVYRQAMTLLETVIVLIIAVSAIAYGAQIYAEYLNGITNRATAAQMKDVTQAYSKYLQDNYATVLASVPPGGSTTVSIATLKPQYLSASFADKNPYSQSYVLAVRQPLATSNALEAIVYTTGGEVIQNKNGLAISQEIGSGGGFTLSQGDGVTVQSTYNGFNLSLAQYSGSGKGKLISALFINQLGAEVSDYYLSRNPVPGRPDLNRMNTDLDMGTHAISNSSGVTAATGNIVASSGSVQGNTVVATTNVTSGGLVIAGSGVQSNGPVSVLGTISSNSAIQGGSIVSLGNMTAAGNVVASGSVDGTTVHSASTISADSTVTAAQNIVSTSGNIQAPAGTVEGQKVKSDTTVALALGQAIKGAGCTMGTIGLDVAGKLYSCVGGAWITSAGFNNPVYGPLRSYGYANYPRAITDHLGGPFAFCSLSYVQADQNSSVCQIYQSGNDWYQYTAAAMNASVGCQAVCIPQ